MMHQFLSKVMFNRWVAFLHDSLWVPVSLLAAYMIRGNLESLPPIFQGAYSQTLIAALPVQALFFWIFGLYRGIWRFASLPDLARIFKAVFCGTALLLIIFFQYNRLEEFPRTVMFLYPLLLICGLAGPRFCYRLFKDRHWFLAPHDGQRTIIVGAGRGGELLVRDLLRRPEFSPVAILDDDSSKFGMELHGIRVCGPLAALGESLESMQIKLVLLAIPSADKKVVRKVVKLCANAGVACRTLPAIDEMQGHDFAVNQLRELTLEDLLGREPVQLDEMAIAGYLKSKSVLVTGGGGSIGSELCRQLAAQNPKRLIIYEHGEFNLYSIDHELRKDFPELEIIAVLGDVKNEDRVDWVFRKFQPDVVFHAAAYKHVPMLEVNPAEGVNNNVAGTRNIADFAAQYGVDRFVLVSTDKAVNPTNVMGTTKRIAELYCQNLSQHSKTKFITTRFGNVLGSAGSVVPLFEKQICAGGPVTVTHRDITRYFMTIPEAVSLILQAGSMGKGGEIFVLDMGEPMLIRDLAEQMIRLSGLEPGNDIEIVYTGLRPGEKLYEEVFHEHENLQGTTHPKLHLAQSRKIDWQWLLTELDTLDDAVASRDVEGLLSHLKQIVPEYDGASAKEELAVRKKRAPLLRVVN